MYWFGIRPRTRSGFSTFALNMLKFWAVINYQQDMLFLCLQPFIPTRPAGWRCLFFNSTRKQSFFVFSSFFGPPRGFLVGSIIKHPSGFTFSPFFPPAASLNQLYLKTAVLSSVFWGFGGLFPLPQRAENITPALSNSIKRPAVQFSAVPVPLAAIHT